MIWTPLRLAWRFVAPARRFRRWRHLMRQLLRLDPHQAIDRQVFRLDGRLLENHLECDCGRRF